MTRGVALVALATLGACSSSHVAEEPIADAGPPLDAATFVDLYARAVCERVIRCAAPYDVNAWWDASGVDCERVFPYLASHRATLERALERDAIAFDPVGAAQCLVELSTSCHVPGSEHPACERAVVGTTPVGGACEDGIECVPDAHCERPSGCTGTCVADAIEGEPCGPSTECAPELACEPEGMRCRPVTRVGGRSAGEPCGLFRGGDGAWIRANCGPELYCIGTCRAFPAEGDECDREGTWPICAPGTTCVPGADGVSRCARPEVRTTPGEACEEPLVLCDRFRGLVCSDGACAAVGGGVGARCDDRFGYLDCEAGTACVDGTCVIAPPPTDPCDP